MALLEELTLDLLSDNKHSLRRIYPFLARVKLVVPVAMKLRHRVPGASSLMSGSSPGAREETVKGAGWSSDLLLKRLPYMCEDLSLNPSTWWRQVELIFHL